MSCVSIETDALLRQVAELKASIQKDERERALALADGLRELIINEALRESKGAETKAEELDSAGAVRVWNEWSAGSRPEGVASYEFSGSVRASGWYEPQVGAKRDTYRWCGRSPEASVLFSSPQGTLRWVILRVRPLVEVGFGDASIAVSVNSTGVPSRLIQEDKSWLLCVPIPVGHSREVHEVLLRPTLRKSPEELGRSGDTRLLAFNVSRIMEIHEPALAGLRIQERAVLAPEDMQSRNGSGPRLAFSTSREGS